MTRWASYDRRLWLAMGALGVSMAAVLSQFHGGYPPRGDLIADCGAVTAFVSVNLVYWRIAVLTKGWRSWGD